jgi:hypothetical protein
LTDGGLGRDVAQVDNTLATSGPPSTYWKMNLQAEIERLRLAIRRLAEQDATLSVCDGAVTVQVEATLTKEEREAIEWAIISGCNRAGQADTLRGLLERTK